MNKFSLFLTFHYPKTSLSSPNNRIKNRREKNWLLLDTILTWEFQYKCHRRNFIEIPREILFLRINNPLVLLILQKLIIFIVLSYNYHVPGMSVISWVRFSTSWKFLQEMAFHSVPILWIPNFDFPLSYIGLCVTLIFHKGIAGATLRVQHWDNRC